jgi:hypothetical protein
MTRSKLLLGQHVAPQPHLLVGQSLIGVPLLRVEQTLKKLLEEPAAIELKISELSKNRGGGTGNFHSENPWFYAKLFRALNEPHVTTSTTADVNGIGPLGSTLEQVGSKHILMSPDVTYDVRGFGEFSLIPANHFKPSDPQLLLLQVPKTVAGFGNWLIGQKNWIIKALGECYFRIGKAQAGFLLELDARKLIEMPITRLKNKLGLPYEASTYWRLLHSRSVKIRSSNRSRTLPVRLLLPTRDEILQYDWIPQFNRVMRDELAAKTAVSDADLSVLVRGVARRTIQKYREAAGIPARWGRQAAYCEGRELPYRIHIEIEAFLREDFGSEPHPNPKIGERTPLYPFGYGWCQCGCNRLTRLNLTQSNPEGTWARYIKGHEPSEKVVDTKV